MSTHIQIGDISPRIQYTGDGIQTVFTYPFPVFTDADIEVYEDAALKTLTTDYTVSGAGNSSGGTVTFVVAPAGGSVVTIRRNIAIKRTSDFQVAGEFRAEVINDELDYQTAALQQLKTDIARSLQLGPTDGGATILPDKVARSGKYLGFDANGDPIATNAAGPTGPQGPAGNMDGANNLNELTSAPTARTNLGLGAAAVENVAAGGVGDLLRADGDGSGLSGIVSGATVAEKANIMLNAFRIAVNGGLTVQNMVDGVADTYTDQTGVDIVASTGQFYDVVNHLYGNADTSNIPQATGTAIGTMDGSSGGTLGVAAAFDGVTNQARASSAGIWGPAQTSGARWVGKDWGVGVTKSVSSVKVYANNSSSGGYFDNPQPDTNIILQVSSDGTNWIDAGTVAPFTSAPSQITTITSTNTGFYRYHRVAIFAPLATTGQTSIAAEVEFFETAVPVNMILASIASAALSAPASAFIVIEEEDVDAVTPNTDLKAYASRDGGTTWTVGTLTSGMSQTADRILTSTIDLSAQPVGVAIKYKIETLNTKQLKIHSVALQWS